MKDYITLHFCFKKNYYSYYRNIDEIPNDILTIIQNTSNFNVHVIYHNINIFIFNKD